MILIPLIVGMSDPLVVEITPSFISESTSSASGTTTAASASVTGGIAPYTYLWESIDGQVTPATPTASTCGFNYSGLAAVFDSVFDSIQLTVTDAASQVTFVYLSVSVFRTS